MSEPARIERLRRMYEAFNERDLDAVLPLLAPDVNWPNALEGGRAHGREGVREYWTRQWSAIQPTVEPIGFTARPGGRIAIDVRQLVRGLDGSTLHDGRVVHVYAFAGGLVSRMDVEEPPPAPG